MKRANVEGVENGYIVNVYATQTGNNKVFVAHTEQEVVAILKKELKGKEKKS